MGRHWQKITHSEFNWTQTVLPQSLLEHFTGQKLSNSSPTLFLIYILGARPSHTASNSALVQILATYTVHLLLTLNFAPKCGFGAADQGLIVFCCNSSSICSAVQLQEEMH